MARLKDCEFCNTSQMTSKEMNQHRKSCPAVDDPRLTRVCNRCNKPRQWIAGFCECGCFEFRIEDHS